MKLEFSGVVRVSLNLDPAEFAAISGDTVKSLAEKVSHIRGAISGMLEAEYPHVDFDYDGIDGAAWDIYLHNART